MVKKTTNENSKSSNRPKPMVTKAGIQRGRSYGCGGKVSKSK